jgi:hypothetical protein
MTGRVWQNVPGAAPGRAAPSFFVKGLDVLRKQSNFLVESMGLDGQILAWYDKNIGKASMWQRRHVEQRRLDGEDCS